MLQSLSDKNKHIAIGAALGVFFTLSTTAIVLATRGLASSHDAHRRSSRRRSSIGENIGRLISLPGADKDNLICDGIAGLIGNTPMMRIKSLSEATGCEILAKAEVYLPWILWDINGAAPWTCSLILLDDLLSF